MSKADTILRVMMPGVPYTSRALTKFTGLNTNTVRGRLSELRAAGKIGRDNTRNPPQYKRS